MTRRQILFLLWVLCILLVGVLITRETESINYGFAASTSLLAISLGVPLMRAMTEFLK